MRRLDIMGAMHEAIDEAFRAAMASVSYYTPTKDPLSADAQAEKQRLADEKRKRRRAKRVKEQGGPDHG